MTRDQFIKLYWRQYLSIEKDFLKTDEYVSIAKKNYPTFSNAYSKLFLTICAEIDSLSVEFSQMIKNDYDTESDIKKNNILKRIDTIKTVYPKINSFRIKTKFPYDELNFVPFSKLSKDNMSDWWHDYNEYKHRRTSSTSTGQPFYEKACLKNVINSLAALYLLCYLVDNYFEDHEDGQECVSAIFEFYGK